MRWAHGFQVLADHIFRRAAAFADIALQPADKTQIGIGIHEDFHVKQVAQLGIGKNQNTLHQNHPPRLDVDRFAGTRVGGEIIHRQLNRFPVAQRTHMLDQQFIFKSIRVIKVDLIVLFAG